MNCDIEWVTIDDVERLWGQFVLQAIAAGENDWAESAENNENFAGETLDVWLWCTEDGGYWWCEKHSDRHFIEE